MYQMRYEDVMADSGVNAREREIILFNRCIDMLKEAEAAGPHSKASYEAANFIDNFWTMLIEDLDHPENALPKDLRINLISIGVFLLKESSKLRQGEQIDFASMITILEAIRNGLSS